MSSGKLTLICIESPNHPSQEALLDCFRNVDYVGEVKEWKTNDGFSSIKVDTDYFAVFYTAEKLEQELVDAIPLFLESGYDVLILWKKMWDEDKLRFFKVPRIFKRGVSLSDACINVASWDGVNGEIVLDGWVTENV